MIPVIAVLQGVRTGDTHAADEIGVGAIPGAPFLLSTIAWFLIGVSVLYFSEQRAHGGVFQFSAEATRRDLSFSLVGYSLAVIAALVPSRLVSLGIAVLLVGLYGVYVYRPLRSGELIEGEDLDALYLGALANRIGLSPESRDSASNPSRGVVLAQTILALAFIVGSAQSFVTEIEFSSAEVLNIPGAVVALLLAPFATELPEKINSVLWISQDKDTLAIGNVTGAMAFQGTLPVTLGILFTSWNLSIHPMPLNPNVFATTSLRIAYVRCQNVLSMNTSPIPRSAPAVANGRPLGAVRLSFAGESAAICS
jgi:cation:H+ antiporter